MYSWERGRGEGLSDVQTVQPPSPQPSPPEYRSDYYPQFLGITLSCVMFGARIGVRKESQCFSEFMDESPFDGG